MIDQKILKKFDKLYDETYKDISRYVVCNCSNIDVVSSYIEDKSIMVAFSNDRKLLRDYYFNDNGKKYTTINGEKY